MHGTIKDAIIEDVYNPPIQLSCIIYDTNPVHPLINVTKKITRKKQTNKICDKTKKSFVEMDYLRLNMIDY